MGLNYIEKKKIIDLVKKVAKNSISAVVADFYGITVEKMTDLRKAGREVGVCMYVLRNTLARRIVMETPFVCLKDNFLGPTLIAFSMEHPGAAARLFEKFSKENDTFKIKVASFEGKIIPGSKISILASLPTYKEAIESLILVIKEAYAGKLLRSLVLISDQKKIK